MVNITSGNCNRLSTLGSGLHSNIHPFPLSGVLQRNPVVVQWSTISQGMVSIIISWKRYGCHVVKTTSKGTKDATNTLRCLTIPGCYTTIRCSDGTEPMKVPVTRKYEQHAFCTGDLAAQDGESKCLVYSFGINGNTEWEAKMSKEFDCDVFAFDPTSKFSENVAPGVTFHQLGLQGAGVDVSTTHSVSYDALDPSTLKTLGEIIKLMKHDGRKIDILRLDCEGCEWGVLKQLACSGESQLVKQLMVEMHFQKNLGLATDDDVLIAADAITCLEDERWMIASMEKSGFGSQVYQRRLSFTIHYYEEVARRISVKLGVVWGICQRR
eukprot:g2779.t1 g2779   contig12:785387-786361(-)